MFSHSSAALQGGIQRSGNGSQVYAYLTLYIYIYIYIYISIQRMMRYLMPWKYLACANKCARVDKSARCCLIEQVCGWCTRLSAHTHLVSKQRATHVQCILVQQCRMLFNVINHTISIKSIVIEPWPITSAYLAYTEHLAIPCMHSRGSLSL